MNLLLAPKPLQIQEAKNTRSTIATKDNHGIKKRVLTVDDEPDTSLVLKLVLEDNGFDRECRPCPHRATRRRARPRQCFAAHADAGDGAGELGDLAGVLVQPGCLACIVRIRTSRAWSRAPDDRLCLWAYIRSSASWTACSNV